MGERRGTKALELWCRRVTEGYSGVQIENMTTSWRDGLAFCAMIHHFRPDLIDFEKLNKSDVYYNNALAFTTAEKYLGIPALLDADDMAAYEVPDRLSILTYLSQFYQVFASQETHNGLKRSSSSHTDKTQVTKSSGPPPKMALVVGVPKRDPCRKCQLPVFLAERLMVGKKVYHRTCLKCARCGHQLTPGSFYETEIDEQYCCETCPDEEVNQNSAEELLLGSNPKPINTTKCEENVIQSPPLKSAQTSIRERLAFFENNGIDDEPGAKLLQKSLSDEEKSKSLQRTESSSRTVELSCKADMTAINSFINTVADEVSFSESSFSMKKTKMGMFDSGDDTTDLINDSIQPELPKSAPPLEKLNHIKKSEEKRFFVSEQLVLGSFSHVTTPEKLDQQQNILNLSITENKDTELQINFSANITDNTNNNTNDREHQTEEKPAQFQPNFIESNLEFSDCNDNDCVTKDSQAEEFSITTETEDPNKEVDRKDATNTNNQLKIKSDKVQKVKKIKTFEKDLVELRTNSDEEKPNVSLQSADNNTIDVITNNEKAEMSCKKSPVNDAESEIMLNKEKITSKLIKNRYSGNRTDENKTHVNIIEIDLKTESLETSNIIDKVPLKIKTNKNDLLSNNSDDTEEHLENNNTKENVNFVSTPGKNNSKTSIEEYPDDLNPFKSDDEDVLGYNKENKELRTTSTISAKTKNLNPFDSSDDEVELEKSRKLKNSINSTQKVPPPRPPPPRILKNPFGSEDEDGLSITNLTRHSSLSGSQNRKTPVPTPRSNISHSKNTTPEPTPQLGTEINTAFRSVSTTPNNVTLPTLRNSSEFYGSANSLSSNNTTPYNLLRNADVRSSNNSLNLSAGGTIRSRKTRKAPLPPAPVKELFPSTETIDSSSKTSTPCSSTYGTPKSTRKKRPAPAPPKPARLEVSKVPQTQVETVEQPKNLNNYPLQSELDSKLSDEEKALLEGKTSQSLYSIESDKTLSPASRRSSKRLIPLDQELLEEHGLLQYTEGTHSQSDDLKQQDHQKSLEAYENETSIVYRRVLIPQNLETPTHDHNPLENLGASSSLGERQLEKLKDNKEANNRNRQSQISVSSSGADDNDSFFNKSAHGKWKRRKGPAPALPVPARKILQKLPLEEIKHEMEIIEVQQQGLEKQGVILEKMIRDRCERENGEPLSTGETRDTASGSSTVENSKEVENLILQLFELVNEKNELFRRQAELMYIRRQHRLEQEQADLEYEIRSLMAQPERNKTDSDKAREEALIERLVEVVQLRNEVVECLEMDRLREAEEDQSIKQRLESHIAKREDDLYTSKTLTKLSKKERKKQKEARKLFKSKKLDADKDADESESNVDKQKHKKKKKLLIF